MATIEDFQQEVDDTQAETDAEAKELDRLNALLASNQAVKETIANGVKVLAAFIKQNQEVTVKNQPKFPTSISTPDVEKVVAAIEKLVQVADDDQPILDALADVKNAINNLPTKIVIPETEKVESVEVSNQIDYTPKFDELTKAVGKIDTTPEVNVSAPVVKVAATDLTPLADKLDQLLTAVGNIKIPTVPKFDTSAITSAVNDVNTAITSLRFPTANYILPFSQGGKATQVTLDSSGNVPVIQKSGLIPFAYDYMAYTNTDSTTDTFVYKTGGSSGTTVATVTIVYTDTTKATISTVTRT